MNHLLQALNSHEQIVLSVIGEWWEVDVDGLERHAAVQRLAAALAEIDLATELTFFPKAEATVLGAFVAAGGRMPVATVRREYGEERQMGPGRLIREEPWFDPANPIEALWYRGLIYRGFDGAAEYYYMPHELLARLSDDAPAAPGVGVAQPAADSDDGAAAEPHHVPSSSLPPLQPAGAPETLARADDLAVDDLTTLLAVAQRTSLVRTIELERQLWLDDAARRSLLLTLAHEIGLLKRVEDGFRPTREAVTWLRQTREQQMRALLDAWRGSQWNALRRTPGLVFPAGDVDNDVVGAREALLAALPVDTKWYMTASLIAAVKAANPDFQRPNGDYTTWYVGEVGGEGFLHGFEHWDRVEGRLLRYLIRGPLHWLGLVDLSDERYRLTERAVAWLMETPPAANETSLPLMIQADGTVIAPRAASRYQRFQLSRVADMQPLETGKPYLYRFTPRALRDAREEGIDADRLLQFLETTTGKPAPASVRRFIERWQTNGVEARLGREVILRVRDAVILEKLRGNAKTRPYIGETLGPLAAVVSAEAWPKLCQAAAQLGLLIDADAL